MKQDQLSNNKRIAKNTMMLYVRMFLTMGVTLYTSRVVLQVLGASDFGIYNVVGGIVLMLSFLNSSLNIATQRYMNVALGKGDTKALNRIFSMSFFSFGILAIIGIILAESFGLWFLYNKLSIPIERFEAANWVFQFSILTFVVNLLTVPYQATIIAHERMSAYAYLSIGEVLLKLSVVFVLQIILIDKLILYAILMFSVTGLISLVYAVYCMFHFSETRLRFIWDNRLIKGLFMFSGWMLLGTTSQMANVQGVNMLINIFFGPALNAARAIAMQIYVAINSFSASFLTAVRPQIVKSYAKGDIDYTYSLVYGTTKMSYFLLLLLVIPIFYNADFILILWLKKVPEYTLCFTKLVLIDLLILSFCNPIAYISQASGKIKTYQIAISICFLCIVLFTWIAYKLDYPVYVTFLISIVLDFIGIFTRLWVLRNSVNFPMKTYLIRVLFPVTVVSIVSFAIGYIPNLWSANIGWFSFVFSIVWSGIFTLLFIWIWGLSHREKKIIIQGFKKMFLKDRK